MLARSLKPILTAMHARRRSLLILLALLVLPTMSSAKLDRGVSPPDYLGKTPNRDEVRISQFKGRIVLVTFWASWCGPCRRELPVLDALKKEAGDRLEIVAVNVKDTTEDYRLIRRQLKKTGLIFTHDTDGVISDGYDVKSYPNLYVIDQAGRISAVHIGFGDESLDRLLRDVNKLLVAPAPAVASTAAN